MDYTKIPINPMTRSPEFIQQSELADRYKRLSALAEQECINGLLIELGVDGNTRFLENRPLMGPPQPGLGLFINDTYYNVDADGGLKECLTGKVKKGDVLGVIYPEKMRYDDSLVLRSLDIGTRDITVPFGIVKARMSGNDLICMKEVSRFHDRIYQSVPSMIRPGRTERDIVNNIRRTAYDIASGGFALTYQILCSIESAGFDGVLDPRPKWPGRKLGIGDIITVKTQAAGLSSFYGGISRSFSMGTPSPETLRKWDVSVSAMNAAVKELSPGKSLKESVAQASKVLDDSGYAAPEGFFIHGVGFYGVESPMNDDPSQDIPLCENMTIYVGIPVRKSPEDVSVCCGNVFLITENGAVNLNSLPNELTVL